MDYGNLHEIDAIATVVGRVLPFYYPDLKFFEEGCIKKSHGTNESFLVVSPDGSFRKDESSASELMYENKCKAPTSYSPSAYYTIPPYYITQLLSEMHAYNCKELLFTCWSKQSTTVFHVSFDQSLWERCWNEAVILYGNDNPKKPTKLSKSAQEIKDMRANFITNNVELLAEIPSCNATLMSCEKHSDSASPYIKPNLVPKLSESVPVSEVGETFVSVQKWLTESYEALRTVASEILVFMLNDLDRNYQFEFNNSHPIAYALKGPSMTVDVMRKMTDMVIKSCEENGIKIVVTASDGQWHNYGIRDASGRPLTVHQLHKDHWKEVRSKDKVVLISKIRQMYRVASLDDLKLEIITEIPTNRKMRNNTQSQRTWSKIVVHGHTRYKPPQVTKWSVKRSERLTNEVDENEDRIPKSDKGCLGGEFEDELDDETLAEIDDVYSKVNTQELVVDERKQYINQSSKGTWSTYSNMDEPLQLDCLFEDGDQCNDSLETENLSLSSTLSGAFEVLYRDQGILIFRFYQLKQYNAITNNSIKSGMM